MEQQKEIITEIFQLVSKREDQTCNCKSSYLSLGCFLKYNLIFSVLEINGPMFKGSSSLEMNKIIYRHYATLFFVFIVDASESELGILDLIQVFVESLDRCFQNVCELDLIFNSEQCYFLINEIVQSGMVLETNINNIIAKFEEQNRIAKVETNPTALKVTSSFKNLPQLKDKVMDLPNTFKDLKF